MAYHFVYVASKAVFRLRVVRIPVAIQRGAATVMIGETLWVNGCFFYSLHCYHLEGVNCRVEVATHITRDFSNLHQGIKSGTELSDPLGIKMMPKVESGNKKASFPCQIISKSMPHSCRLKAHLPLNKKGDHKNLGNLEFVDFQALGIPDSNPNRFMIVSEESLIGLRFES